MRLKLLLLILFILPISIFAQATLKEKIAQMIMVGFSGTAVPDSLRYDIQFRKLGGVVLFGANIINPAQLQNLTMQLQSYANNSLLISVDQEGGRVARLNQNNGFAATNSAHTQRCILCLYPPFYLGWCRRPSYFGTFYAKEQSLDSGRQIHA